MCFLLVLCSLYSAGGSILLQLVVPLWLPLLAWQGGVEALLLPAVPACLTRPLELLPDPVDCHTFYQCDLSPQPRTCGNLMFNTVTQVCDWPHRVLQLRPECRKPNQFVFHTTSFPYHRCSYNILASQVATSPSQSDRNRKQY